MFVTSETIQAVIASYGRTMARYERAHYELLKYYKDTTAEMDFYDHILAAKERKAVNLAKAKAKAWDVTNTRIHSDAYSSGIVLETE